MPLHRLSQESIECAINKVLEHCNEGTLEKILSQQDVYLGFQPELLNLHGEERHQRLAELIVHVLGDGLLRTSKLRETLCASTGVPIPSAWRPGSPLAISTCEALGLPEAFAGTLPPSKPSPVERLHVFRPTPPLRDFQEEVLEKAISSIAENRSCLLSLPTGGGKTLVGTTLLKQWHIRWGEQGTSVWLAHTEELCEQAAACIEQVWQSDPHGQSGAIMRAWGPSVTGLIRGSFYLEGEGKIASPSQSVIVTTPRSALRILQECKTGSLKRAVDNLGLVIIDEAHRAGASTYKDLISRAKTKFPHLQVVGLSATPLRDSYSAKAYKGTEQLTKLFENLIEPTQTLSNERSSVAQLQELGILASLKVERLGRRITGLKSQLQQVAIRAREPGRTGLLFAQSVAQAKVATTYLREFGVSADYVVSESSAAERASLVSALKRGDIQVLSNCEILTTGFDAPKITDIYLFRATNSPVLYKQIVGRGLRGAAFGGGDSCNLFLCGVDLAFDPDPNTSDFARAIWSKS